MKAKLVKIVLIAKYRRSCKFEVINCYRPRLERIEASISPLMSVGCEVSTRTQLTAMRSHLMRLLRNSWASQALIVRLLGKKWWRITGTQSILLAGDFNVGRKFFNPSSYVRWSFLVWRFFTITLKIVPVLWRRQPRENIDKTNQEE